MARIARVVGAMGRAVLLLAAPPQCTVCGARVLEAGRLCRRCLTRLFREQRRSRDERRSLWLEEKGVRRAAAAQDVVPAQELGSAQDSIPAQDSVPAGDLVPTEHADVARHVTRRATRVVAAGVYLGAWAKLVSAYKREDHRPASRRLEERLARALSRARLLDGVTFVPVPMAAVRRRERGENPAERLAYALGRMGRGSTVALCLARTRYRRPLRGLSARERREEMSEAVVCLPAQLALGMPARVVLVDDVVTTGATLSACRQALGAVGIDVVAAAALGATPRRARREARGRGPTSVTQRPRAEGVTWTSRSRVRDPGAVRPV